MTNPKTQIFPTPWGELYIAYDDKNIFAVQWQTTALRQSLSAPTHTVSKLKNPDSPLGKTQQWLQSFILGSPISLELPLKIQGESYQYNVWQALKNVGWGEKITYGDLARDMMTGSPRSVGQACRANSFVLIIPCHRVVSRQKNRGGYAGGSVGLNLKAALLHHEATTPFPPKVL